MKKLVSNFLLFAILIQISGSLVTLMSFELNRNFIAKNLCENRFKPKSKCHGKCHLMKELQKEEKKNDSSGSSVKNKIEHISLHKEIIQPSFSQHSFSPDLIFYSDSKTVDPSTEIFRPPAAFLF